MRSDPLHELQHLDGTEPDSIVQKYEDYLQSPLGWLRDQLIWQQLTPRLAGSSLCILDAGCGPGALALRLAHLGHVVRAIDYSPSMITRAQQVANIAPSGVRARLTYAVADLEHLPSDLMNQSYDVILCHNVLEYIPDPSAVVQQFGKLLTAQGAVSLVVANRASLPLKTAIAGGDLGAALELVETGIQPTTVFGVAKRTFAREEMVELCANAGLLVQTTRPIRVVADLLAQAVLVDEALRPQLLALEAALSGRPEYRDIGRMTWVWGTRWTESGAV